MTELLNQLMSNGGDCRTAPATPGLLISNWSNMKPQSGGLVRSGTPIDGRTAGTTHTAGRDSTLKAEICFFKENISIHYYN